MTDVSAPPKHSHLGASNADRWLNCPGSFSLCQGIPEPPSSSYAVEGTRAHELAELMLRQPNEVERGLETGNYLDPSTYISKYPGDMIAHCQAYVDRCREELASFDQAPKAPQFRIEQRLVFDDDLGMFGTADFLATGYKTGVPCGLVVDLKYGKGKPVKAEANPQLAYYATALWKQSKLGLKSVKVVVFQPRVPNGVTEVIYQEEDLRYWARTLLAGAEKCVWQHLMKKPEYVTGRHCWFCPARLANRCPAQQEKRLKDAAKDFE